jgi:hypothetical protein
VITLGVSRKGAVVQRRMQEMLVEQIEQQSWWRQQKAQEYPEDERNMRAPLGLGELANYVRGLPPDDEVLVTLERWHDDYGTGVMNLGEQSSTVLSRFRFDRPNEQCDAFMHRFLAAFISDRKG